MIHKFLTIAFFFLTTLCCFGQNNQSSGYWPKKYINLGFINGTLEQESCPSLKSNYGVSFSVGRTFYLHKPIGNCLRFGIDATWFNLTYTNYKVTHVTYSETESFNIHEAEAGMQVGPSIAINPVAKMNINAYFRYAPSFSCFYSDDRFQGQYATYFVSGGSISYHTVGLGIEWRYGTSKFEPLLNLNDSDESQSKVTSKTNGFRAYITFKF